MRVQAAPTLQTVVSAQTAAVGTAITDKITVSGLAGEPVTDRRPRSTARSRRGDDRLHGDADLERALQVTADGEFTTAPYTVETPGYYTYLESIDAGDFVRAVKTPCADIAETTIVTARRS